MIDQKRIREDFPQLRPNTHYLDTAASSLTPTQVIQAMDDYYIQYRANIHRGLYKESVKATEAYEEARRKIAVFIGAEPGEIIFTPSATHSANMLVRTLEESFEWKEGETIVTTIAEHHGTLVPLQQFAKRRSLALGYIDASSQHIQGEPSEHARIVSVMLVSNVFGTKFPVSEIANNAHTHGSIVISDATAAVGHTPVDVRTLGVDALWFSGHKILGPTGIGVLWVKRELLEKLEPSVFGGDMVERVTKEGAAWAEIPTRFEAGTPNIAGAIGLGGAIDYLGKIGVENIEKHSATLALQAYDALAAIPGARVLSPKERNVGTISFTIDGVHPHDVGQILADSDIAVRAGHHCAMPLHQSLGISASTRASFYLYNTEDDVSALVEGVRSAQKKFK